MSDFPDALKNHMDNEGRLIEWPSKKSLQAVVLVYLAGKFEAGRLYKEREVNELLKQWHTFGDHALLRRELFEAGYINREKDGSAYWATPLTKMIE
ncbi:MAG TPA: DUF2087 domain-containing protein [Aggregatilineales bacterium]|nr:DUF2087 domain-containing protein [Aggregatilineales bacterium]